MALSYGPDRQRWKEVYTNSSGTETTYHAGKLFEVAYYLDGGSVVAHYRHYVYAGNELVSIDDRSTATTPQYYVISDHQGSYTSIENGASPGSNFVSESFTAFGNRRNGETWSGAPTTADESNINIVSRRGYTGESALGISMGLNHLNGRVEDSITGRFLSADPLGINLGNTQSFNRYSYVNNNPLSLTDPTGFDDQCDDQDGLCEITITATQILDPVTVTSSSSSASDASPSGSGAGPGSGNSGASGGGPASAVPTLDPAVVQCTKCCGSNSGCWAASTQTDFGPASTGGSGATQAQRSQSPAQCRAGLEKWVQAGAGAAGGAAAGFIVAGPGGALAGIAAGGVTGFTSGYLSGAGAPDPFTAAATAPVGYVSSAFAAEAFAGGATFSGAMYGAAGGAVGAIIPAASGAGAGAAVSTIDIYAGLADTGLVGIVGGVTAYFAYQGLDAAANQYCGVN